MQAQACKLCINKGLFPTQYSKLLTNITKLIMHHEAHFLSTDMFIIIVFFPLVNEKAAISISEMAALIRIQFVSIQRERIKGKLVYLGA